MTDLMQQAREQFEAWATSYGYCFTRLAPYDYHDGEGRAAWAAWQAALRAAPEGLIEQHARDSQELRRLCQSRDFYKLRCEALQAAQSNMRDPERKAVCDILANGSTSALASRPQGVR